MRVITKNNNIVRGGLDGKIKGEGEIFPLFLKTAKCLNHFVAYCSFQHSDNDALYVSENLFSGERILTFDLL